MAQLRSEFFIRRGSGEMPPLSLAGLGSLLKPLGSGVWWTLLASVFVLSVVLRLTLWLSHPRGEERQTVKEMTWRCCLLCSFMSVIGQSWETKPNSMAARIATMSCWFLGTMIYTSYTANLISSLTVVTVDRPISSLKEFSEQSDWKFAIVPGHGHLNDWKQGDDVYKRELFWRTVSGQGFIALTWTPEGHSKHNSAPRDDLRLLSGVSVPRPRERGVQYGYPERTPAAQGHQRLHGHRQRPGSRQTDNQPDRIPNVPGRPAPATQDQVDGVQQSHVRGSLELQSVLLRRVSSRFHHYSYRGDY